jgi:hypothetical protein
METAGLVLMYSMGLPRPIRVLWMVLEALWAPAGETSQFSGVDGARRISPQDCEGRLAGYPPALITARVQNTYCY